MRSSRTTRRAPGERATRSETRFWPRFRLLCCVLAACLSIATTASPQQRPRLVAYLQVSVKSRALESALAKQMPGVDVVVCSRYRDFERELLRAPDAVLALGPVLLAHGMQLDLKGTRSGEDSEPYVLLSIGAAHDKARYRELVIGAVDLLGRKRTADFVAGLLGLPAAPEIKYVIKSEDLLPLLQFRSADAVLLSEQDAMRLKTLSKLDLRLTALTPRVGLPALSLRSEAGRRIVRRNVEALDLETRRKLGVEAWR